MGAGKGDKPRPRQVSDKVYTKNYEQIFGKKRNWWERRDQKWLKEAEKMKHDDK